MFGYFWSECVGFCRFLIVERLALHCFHRTPYHLHFFSFVKKMLEILCFS